MGFSIADQLNQLPRDMEGNVLGSGGGMPNPDGLTPQVGVELPGNTAQQPADVMPAGGSTPGMGGKGGIPMPTPQTGTPGMGGKAGGPMSQIPIDMNGNLLGGNYPEIQPMPEQPAIGGLPPAPITPAPLARTSGGTTGRPSPSAPMVPRGPGFANPGAPGAPPQQPMERSILTNPQGQPQPVQGGMQNKLPPARPVFGQQAQGRRLSGRGPLGGFKGAGRGGLLR